MILDTNALSAFADDVPTVVQQIGSITSRFVKGDSFPQRFESFPFTNRSLRVSITP